MHFFRFLVTNANRDAKFEAMFFHSNAVRYGRPIGTQFSTHILRNPVEVVKGNAAPPGTYRYKQVEDIIPFQFSRFRAQNIDFNEFERVHAVVDKRFKAGVFRAVWSGRFWTF